MQTIAQDDFTKNFFTLLKETFEGPPPQTASAYLDQGGGLFQSLDKLTAGDASRRVKAEAPTIAAHCAHVKFYIEVLHRLMHEPVEKIDWKESWSVQEVGPPEWDAVKRGLRQAYDAVVEDLRATGKWGDVPVGHGLAILTHTAYHLGAIRQLMRMLARS